MRPSFTWALLLLTGCGESAMESFPGDYASAVCSQSFKCCTKEDLTDHTRQSCQENTSFALSVMVGSIDSSQGKGRARFQSDKARACVDALKAMSCDQWKSPVTRDQGAPTCDELVLGLVDDGKPCGADFDCKSTFCDGEQEAVNDKPAKDGVCKPVAAEGTACAEDEGCAKGTFCDEGAMKCAATKEDGARCFDERECKSGMCDDMAGKCTSTPPKGACYAGCSFGCGPPAGLAALLLVLAALALRRRRA